VSSLLAVHGEADPDQPTVGFAPGLAGAHLVELDGADRPAQAFGVVAGIEVLLGHVVERHLLGTHQILEPDLVRLQAELAGQRIDGQFHGKTDAGARHAAVRQDRRLVGRNRVGLAAVVREVVDAGQDARDLRRFQARREGIRGIGAGIDGRLAVDRQQPAVAVGVGGDHVMVLPAVGRRRQVLAPVLEPAQRPADLARRPAEADFLGQENPLVAKAAAHVGRDHAHAGVVEAETLDEA